FTDHYAHFTAREIVFAGMSKYRHPTGIVNPFNCRMHRGPLVFHILRFSGAALLLKGRVQALYRGRIDYLLGNLWATYRRASGERLGAGQGSANTGFT